jgi:hypothetical protein
MKDNLASEIRIFLESHGIDPIYASTIFVVLISISYRKQIRNWDEQLGWQKLLIVTTVTGAVIFLMISLLRFLSIIDL